jgi:two-component system cell cycle response regulator PopA
MLKHAKDSAETPPATGHAAQRVKVLIVTDNPSVTHDIVSDLRKVDLDVQLAFFDGSKLASIPREAPAAILCFFSDHAEKTKGICQVLRGHYAPKTPPIIGAMMQLTELPTDHFDSVLFAPMHSSQIANRVASMIRLGDMEMEITRRIETLREDFGQDIALSSEDLDRPFRILFIGKAAPGFMVVINALQSKNVEVVAAFTSFSAFDYLHDRHFDAVVMNALEQPEPALTITETMKRNARLYHVPTLLLIDDETFAYRDDAYARGVRDLIPVSADLAEISGRILELANYHRIHEQLKLGYSSLGGPDCVDEETGLFTLEFFTKHLSRVSEACRKTEDPISLLAIRPKAKNADDIDPVYIRSGVAKIGGMIKNMIRMQDVMARYDDETLILAFAGASPAVTASILERMRGLVDCAAFESGRKDNSAFAFNLDAAIVDQTLFEDGEMVIRKLMAKLDGEPVEIEPHSAVS